MSTSCHTKHFHDEDAAYKWVEAILWPDGPAARTAAHWIDTERVSKLEGKATRLGALQVLRHAASSSRVTCRHHL